MELQEMIGGYKMPSVGLGTAGLFGEDAEKVVEAALEAGYRHIDTAFGYRNEDAIGKVLNRWLTSGKIKREELFITTKLPEDAVHPDFVEDRLKKSLAALQLDYVDLYLIHFPVCMEKPKGPQGPPPKAGEQRRGPPPIMDPLPTDHLAVWKKMEEQVDAGRAKTIGLSNFIERQIENIWNAARIKPSCNQIELSPFLQTPPLVDYCQKKGIIVVAYSTIRAPRSDDEKHKHMNVFTNEIIKKISEKHNKSPAQIVLRYFVQKNVGVIPRSFNPERLKQNLELFNFSLDADDVQSIAKMDIGEAGRRMNMKGKNPKVRAHPEYPWES